MIGIPLNTDRYTNERVLIKYARLLIDVPMDGPFPEYIEFFNEYGDLIRQLVTFEWKPCKCTHCEMFGHLEADCRKKLKLRKEWRPVLPPNRVPEDQSQPAKPAEEGVFTSVTRKTAAKQPTAPVQITEVTQNSFQVLLNEELVDKGTAHPVQLASHG